MFYDFACLVPKGTTKANPVKYTLKLTYGVIQRVELEFPAGCRGYVSCAIDWEGHQLYPTDPDGAFNSEDFVVGINDHFPLLTAAYCLYFRGWAPDADYDHIITVRVGILTKEELTQYVELVGAAGKVITFLGGGPPTPEVPTPPAPPPPAPPAPAPPPAPPLPVCTIGETKCEGYDLYECQEIEGEADWVLKEENSTQCGYVPTPPPVPPSPPPTVPELEGSITSIQWVEGEVLHDISEPMPHMTNITHRFSLSNTGTQATFKLGYSYYSEYESKTRWNYSPEKVIEPGEGFIDWVLNTSYPGTTKLTFQLFANGYKVDERTVTITVT